MEIIYEIVRKVLGELAAWLTKIIYLHLPTIIIGKFRKMEANFICVWNKLARY